MNTPLHCLLLQTPGELLEGEKDFLRLGYAVEAFPFMQDASCLDDAEAEELPLHAYAPGWRHGALPEVRSRRASLVRMLTDPRWQKEDFLIFGESGAVPLVEAATLRAALEKELNAHPETHLLRLFHHKAHSPNDPRKVVASLRFSAYQPGRERSKASLYVSGLHAFVVPSVHRKKVADVLCHTPLPPDRALELAAARGTLNIRVAESNLFYQKPRTQRAQAVSESNTPESSIAVCLVVRHLENLDRLLSLFMAQPYGNCHVFAAVKGMTADNFSSLVLPRYEHWIRQGRVTLRHYPGKNQVSDLIDTIRGVELSSYDLFVFPREELLCPSGLLERINRLHARLSPHHCSCERGECRMLTTRNGVQYAEPPAKPARPLFYTLTREAAEYLIACERNPAKIAGLYPDRQDPEHGAYGHDADALMMQLVRHSGGWDLSDIEKEIFLMVRPSPAVSLNNPLVEMEENLHEAITDDPASAEYLVELEHPYWTDNFRILGVNGCRVKLPEKATVLRFTERELVLQWERWGREQFIRDKEEGPYRLHHTAALRRKAAFNPGRRQESLDLVERALADPPVRWGVCAVALPRESCYWLRDWIEFHLRAGAFRVVIYDNTGSTGSRRVDSVFQAGQLQRSGTSKRGEEYGRLTAHLSDEDIKNKLDGLAARYGRERGRIVPWQPKDPETGQIIHGQVEAYEDFIRRWGKELDWCAFLDVDEYLYCRPGTSVGAILEQVESKTPDVSRIMLKAWKFRRRWGKDGPRDIRRDTAHLPQADGGEKNLVRLCDVKAADIHWYWQMRHGTRRVTADPEGLAFCHYNASDKEMEKALLQPQIRPRDFLTAEVDERAAVEMR